MQIKLLFLQYDNSDHICVTKKCKLYANRYEIFFFFFIGQEHRESNVKLSESNNAQFTVIFGKISLKCRMTSKGRHSHVESSKHFGSHEFISFIQLLKEFRIKIVKAQHNYVDRLLWDSFWVQIFWFHFHIIIDSFLSKLISTSIQLDNA